MKLRISKYRANSSIEEWTSLTDIGKTYEGEVLTQEQYLAVEDLYTKAIGVLCNSLKFDHYYIIGLEKASPLLRYNERYKEIYTKTQEELYERVLDGIKMDISSIDDLIRLILREEFWCQIAFIAPSARITFGYDYYMYFETDIIDKPTFDALSELGLQIIVV